MASPALPFTDSERPEAELLLLCASPVENDARSARIRCLLDRAIDWNHLQELAESHRLIPLLCRELESVRPDLIPRPLADRFERIVRSNLFLTCELFRILDLFEREAIPAIPFKGPTLAVSACNSLALRMFVDLDILVRPEDAWRARDVLLRAGFRSGLRLDPEWQPAYLRYYDELVLDDERGDPLLELHWAFVRNYFSVSLDLEEMWDRSTTVSLGDRAVASLHPEDLFLLLCLHGSKHCWSYLGLICDVAWFLTAQEIDWERVLARARETGVHRMILLGVSLSRLLFEVPVAEPVERALRGDAAVPLLAEQTIDVLFGDGHDEDAIFRTGLLHMRMRERPMDRLRYFYRLATLSGIEDWQMVDLPQPLSFLYPALRFPRLLSKYWLRDP